MLRAAFAETFATPFEPMVQQLIVSPCETVQADDTSVIGLLVDVDVLVTLGFTVATGKDVGPRLKLVQLPAAGLGRINCAALPASVMLANAYDHESGIAKYAIGQCSH